MCSSLPPYRIGPMICNGKSLVALLLCVRDHLKNENKIYSQIEVQRIIHRFKCFPRVWFFWQLSFYFLFFFCLIPFLYFSGVPNLIALKHIESGSSKIAFNSIYLSIPWTKNQFPSDFFFPLIFFCHLFVRKLGKNTKIAQTNNIYRWRWWWWWCGTQTNQKNTTNRNTKKKIASAEPFSYNYPTNTSCVDWNRYYTNCTQLGGNPFQGTISFDNIGMAWVAIFLVISLEGWLN